MIKLTFRIGLATLAIVLVANNDVSGRGGGRGGGGRGGGGGMGGGMSRPSPAMGRSPSMARPATPMNRPSMPSIVPVQESLRTPSVGGPGVGARPGVGAPGAGAEHPGVGGPGAGAGVRARPSAGQLNDFLNIGPSGGARPGTLPSRSGAGGAAADFLQGGGARTAPVLDRVLVHFQPAPAQI